MKIEATRNLLKGEAGSPGGVWIDTDLFQNRTPRAREESPAIIHAEA
jgi:hypothetical protein